MEEEIKSMKLGVEIGLIPSSGGVFDIKLDDRLIFSKKSLSPKRFPKPDEIKEILSNYKI